MTTTVDIYVNDIVVEVGVTGPGRKGDPGTSDYLELENRPDAEIAQGVEAFGWGNHADAGYALQSSLSDVATTGDYNDLINTPSIPQGDMEKVVYDPNNKEADAFSMDNMEEGVDSKIFTQAERTKLEGIAAEATKNDSDAQLRDRSTHTGVQPISSVQGLQDVLDGKVEDNDPRLTNARDWTASVVTQVEAETGTATTARKWTAQRVRQAILGWWNSSAAKTKLDGIEEGATANATDAQLRDRSTHTGVQPISSVTGLQTSLNSKLENITSLVQAGEGISITGDGTSGSPYLVASVAQPSVVEERVGDSYTIVSSDLSKHLVFTEENNPISLLIPDDATLDMGIGSTVTFVGREQEVVLVPSAGVTLESFYRYPITTMYERSVFSLIKEGANTWRVVGFEKEEE